MRVVPLMSVPCYQITPSTTRRGVFWLRLDESVLVPTSRPDAPLTVEIAYLSSTVRLIRYLLGKRAVFYVLRFTRQKALPRVIYREWYVQAFYRPRIGSIRVLYDDGQVRLVGGGPGHAYVFVYLRLGRIGLPSDDTEPSSVAYRSNLTTTVKS